MGDDERGMTSNALPFGGEGQARPPKPYRRPVLLVHGSLRELTQGAASGNGDGASFGKKAPAYPKH
jgi:hypothetical protein